MSDDLMKWFDDLLSNAEKRGLRIRFWTCPLHFGPTRAMPTVQWDGDEATCLLCGFTRSEHMRRLAAAEAHAGEKLRTQK